MIRAVFFDLYNTLVHYDPLPEELHVAACQQFGIKVAPQAILKAMPAADHYFFQENTRFPIEKRSAEEKSAVYAEYESRLLRGAGADVSPQTALKILLGLKPLNVKLVLFADVLPALAWLKQRVVVRGVISNVDKDISPMCAELGLTSYLDFVVTSMEVGWHKPHPQIFEAALKKAASTPAEAIHVGDQYDSDVVGARSAGIKPILLDRNDLYPQISDCPRIRSLAEVEKYI